MCVQLFELGLGSGCSLLLAEDGDGWLTPLFDKDLLTIFILGPPDFLKLLLFLLLLVVVYLYPQLLFLRGCLFQFVRDKLVLLDFILELAFEVADYFTERELG